MSNNYSYPQMKQLYNAGLLDKVIETLNQPFQQLKLKNGDLLLLLGNSFCLMNRFSEVEKVFQFLQSLGSKITLEQQLEAQLLLCDARYREGKLDEARVIVEQLIKQSVNKFPNIYVASKELHSQIIQSIGNMEDAITLLQGALDECAHKCSDEAIARPYVVLGNHYGRAGYQKKAIEAYKKGYEIAVKEKLVLIQMQALNNLGASYFELDDHQATFEYLLELRRISPSHDGSTYIISGCNIGELQVERGKLEEALASYNESLLLAQKNNFKRFESLALTGLATVHYVYGNYDKVADYLNNAEELAIQTNSREMMINVYELRSRLQARIGKLDAAIRLIEKVIGIKEENKILEGILRDFTLIIEYYLEINNTDKACDLRERMFQYCTKSDVSNRWLLSVDADIAFKNSNFGMAKEKFLAAAKEYETKEIRELQIRSYLKVAKLSLFMALFQETSDLTEQEINNAHAYVLKAAELAEKIQDIHYIIESYQSKSTIELAQGELMLAVQTLTWALAFTTEKKLVNYQQRIARRLAEIKNIETLESTQDSIMLSQFWQRQGLRTAIDGVREALSYTDPLFEKKPIFTNIVFYRFSVTGPEFFYSEKPIDAALGVSAGVFMYTSIGQGESYRTGLFGPLPWGKKETEVALVHSQHVIDLNPPDTRFHLINFVIVALVLQQGKTHLIDRQKLQQLLSSRLSEIKNLSAITDAELKGIVQAIRDQGW